MFFLSTLDSCCKQTFKSFLWLFIIAATLSGVRVVTILQSYDELETYREKINYVIHHRSIFLTAYKIKTFTRNQLTRLIRTSPSINGSLVDWFESRIMYHVEHGELESVKDLPLIERITLRSLDGTSAISKLTRKLLTAITCRLPLMS